VFGLGTRGDGVFPACVLDYPETEDNGVEKGLPHPLVFRGWGEPESKGNIPLRDRPIPCRPSTKHLPCVWFGDQVGWDASNPVFWDGMNPFRVWFEGWSRSSFLFGMWDGAGLDEWDC
jgi:hypothetical protein